MDKCRGTLEKCYSTKSYFGQMLKCFGHTLLEENLLRANVEALFRNDGTKTALENMVSG